MPPVISSQLRRVARAVSNGGGDVCLDAELVAAAVAFELGPLLYWQQRESNALERLEPAAAAVLGRSAREAVLLESVRAEDLAATISALQGAGVSPLVFKGAAVAALYPQRWTRPRGDTDLLVAPDQAAAAAAVLSRLGLVRLTRPGGRYVTGQARFDGIRGGVAIAYDLHWRLSDPHVLADAFPFPELAAAARRDADSQVRVPGLVHALAIACVHRVAHHHDEIAPLALYDIHLLSHAFAADDWVALSHFAVRHRITAICRRSLSLAVELFDSPVPDTVFSALTAGSDEEPSAVFVGGARRIDALRSDLAALPHWTARLELIRDHVFPGRDYMQAAYGPFTPALLPVLYARRLIFGARAWCARG